MNISLGKAIGLAVIAAVASSLVTTAVLKADTVVPEAVVEAPAPATVPTTVPGLVIPPTPQIATNVVIDVASAIADRSIGKPDAPVTIIEYASMTCEHCAAFHSDVLDEVKKQLIYTGKARLVFRDMPWDQYALAAAKIARCAAPDKYFETVAVMFKNQPQWARSTEPLKGLYSIGLGAGLDEEHVKACLGNEALDKAVLGKVQEAQKLYEVKSTPAFIFIENGERQEHYPAFEEIFKQLGAHKHE